MLQQVVYWMKLFPSFAAHVVELASRWTIVKLVLFFHQFPCYKKVVGLFDGELPASTVLVPMFVRHKVDAVYTEFWGNNIGQKDEKILVFHSIVYKVLNRRLFLCASFVISPSIASVSPTTVKWKWRKGREEYRTKHLSSYIVSRTDYKIVFVRI